MDELRKDERFAHILTDPKFRRIRKQDQKVKVDNRFKSLITSTKSQTQCKIDKRGRPVKAAKKNDFHRFYGMSDSEEETGTNFKKAISQNSIKQKEKMNANNKDADNDEEDKEEEEVEDTEEEEETEDEETEDEEDDEEDDDDDDEEEEDDEEEKEDKCKEKEDAKIKGSKRKKSEKIPDYSRGIGNESSSDEGDDDECNYEGEIEESPAQGPAAAIHPWADQLEQNIPVVEESSRRLAVCNMNWDYVGAQDLMLLCNSFKPQEGTVISVKIYPTDFGLERMKEESLKGPKVIVGGSGQDAAKSKGKRNERKLDAEKLRPYELNRLRYYVAVVECDSVETADHIYSNCDGLEFEKTGTKLDFRYVPNDVTFDHEPRSVATALPLSGTYKPPHFVDSALSKTDVKLSWDKTSHKRLAITQMDLRKVKNVDELEDEIKEYLAPYASDDDDDDDDDDGSEDPYGGLDWSYVSSKLPEKKDVEEMKRLLLEPEVKESKADDDDDEIDMEITWEIGLKDSLEDAAKEKQKQTTLAKMTPFEQYKQKRKEKKRQKEREKRRTKKNKEADDRTAKNDGVDLETFFVGENEEEEEERKKFSGRNKSKNDKHEGSGNKRPKESLKQRAKRRKQEMEEQSLEVSQAILSDTRFADLANKDFAIDPSAPEFHKKRRKF